MRRPSGILGTLRHLLGDQRGAIGILGALALVGVIGCSALALEYGHGLPDASTTSGSPSLVLPRLGSP